MSLVLIIIFSLFLWIMDKNEVDKSLRLVMNGTISEKINHFERLSIVKYTSHNTQSFNKIIDYGKLE